jgi:hypothetical protein
MEALFPRVEKNTHTKMSIQGKDGGEFAITATWKEKDGTERSFSKLYNCSVVFGTKMDRRTPKQKPCDFTSELIGEILRARGV